MSWPSDLLEGLVSRACEPCCAGSELGEKPHEVLQAAAILLEVPGRCWRLREIRCQFVTIENGEKAPEFMWTE